MGYVVKMPKLGLEMEQGTLLEWYVEEGDPVEEGEVIAEIESEKSIGEVEAREDGVLRLADLEEGETVPPGAPIGIVADPDEDVSDLRAEFEAASDEAEAEVEAGGAGGPVETGTGSAGTEGASDSGSATSTEPEVKASPRAKRRAEEVGVALDDIDGSGPGGAITEDDVEAAAESSGGETASATPEATTEQVKASPRAKRRAEELGVDLDGIDSSGPGGAITEDDVEAAAESPSEAVAAAAPDAERAVDERKGRYRTTTVVVEGGAADTLIEATELAANAFDVETSPLDVLLVAVSAALEEHPVFNATVEDETHHLHSRQGIALAAEFDGELLEPVIEEVEGRTFADLVETRHETVASGVSGGRATFALALAEEFDGGVESLVAAPTAAGLLADVSRRRAVPAENGVSLERCLSLSLAYDTRVLGDRDAEAFLETLLERIGNAPALVLRTYRERTP